jgi:hypothetical protein
VQDLEGGLAMMADLSASGIGRYRYTQAKSTPMDDEPQPACAIMHCSLCLPVRAGRGRWGGSSQGTVSRSVMSCLRSCSHTRYSSSCHLASLTVDWREPPLPQMPQPEKHFHPNAVVLTRLLRLRGETEAQFWAGGGAGGQGRRHHLVRAHRSEWGPQSRLF